MGCSFSDTADNRPVGSEGMSLVDRYVAPNLKDSPANRRSDQILQRPISVNFDGTRLEHVFDFFRDATGLEFFVDWHALQNVAMERDAPITLRVSNVSIAKAITLVFMQVCIDGGNSRDLVGFTIINGVVVVSTAPGKLGG